MPQKMRQGAIEQWQRKDAINCHRLLCPARRCAWRSMRTHNALPRYHVLFEWLDSRFLPTRDQDAVAAMQVGSFTACLHHQAQTFAPSPAFMRRSLDLAHLFDWAALDAAPSAQTLFTNAHRARFREVQERTH